jgi:hypothetical protein
MINEPKQENCASGQIIFRDEKHVQLTHPFVFIENKNKNLVTRHHVS